MESKITANNIDIAVISKPNEEDYISLTDIARYKNPEEPNVVVANWMRVRSTIEFLGLWEQLNNPDFNPIEFEGFKNEAGANAFTLSPKKWIVSTNAIGIRSKSGRYGGGTFAHKDIAFEFASWVSPEFKLYVIKDYQRLKQDESHKLALEWDVRRIIAKTNYRIHTDAIKYNLIPESLPQNQQGFIYASEADVLNKALFGFTAAEWRTKNPDKKGNVRDYASIEELLILANLENTNAMLIDQGISQIERLTLLHNIAISQLKTLIGNKSIEKLDTMNNQLKLPTEIEK